MKAYAAAAALISLLALAACDTSGTASGSSPSVATDGCPSDVSEADRYKFPACNGGGAADGCPADVSQADRYKYPACQ